MYNAEFYEQYNGYLHEHRVRKSHDSIFRIFQAYTPAAGRVLDLGCGLSQEFYRWGHWEAYHGLDLNQTPPVDYRKEWAVEFQKFQPTVFISLFSTEIYADAATNYALYDELFQAGVVKGMVSGFFYEKRRDEKTVGETGGLLSHQSIDPICSHSFYDETRIILPVPSKFFGDDVFEVWKIFTKKSL